MSGVYVGRDFDGGVFGDAIGELTIEPRFWAHGGFQTEQKPAGNVIALTL